MTSVKTQDNNYNIENIVNIIIKKYEWLYFLENSSNKHKYDYFKYQIDEKNNNDIIELFCNKGIIDIYNQIYSEKNELNKELIPIPLLRSFTNIYMSSKNTETIVKKLEAKNNLLLWYNHYKNF